VTGKDICKALEDFNYDNEGDIMGGGAIPSCMYTPEAFVDAIVKWIVADDQVRIYYFIWFLY